MLYRNPAIDVLAGFNQWVLWKPEQRGASKKPTKVPYCIGGRRKAASDDPATWDTFNACYQSAFVDGHVKDGGIGFVLTRDLGIVGVDCDWCIGSDGEVEGSVLRWIARFNSYAEISPSGNGIRIFCRGVLPGGIKGMNPVGSPWEIYGDARFLTVTGKHIEESPLAINEAQEAIDSLCAIMTAGKSRTSTSYANGHDKEPMSLADMRRALAGDTPNAWHTAMLAMVGRLVTKGAEDWFILDWAMQYRWDGYGEEETRRDIARMIEGARAKGWAPQQSEQPESENPDPNAEPPPPAPFLYVEHHDMEDELPLRPFLVDRWVPLGCVTSLYGSGGTGKSFLAMMMAMCVAAGRDWLGFSCEQATVLAVMCEDDADEIRRRRNKIARSLGIYQEDVADRLWLTPRVGEVNALMEFPHGVATRAPLLERIVSEAKRTGARLIILDNAAQLYGGNENDRAQVTAFLNAVAGIAKEVNGSVILLGHPPKMANVEFSGSTAWDAVVRSRIWFKRVEDDGECEVPDGPERYTLELVKSNYAKRFGVELQENAQGVVEYVGELTKTNKGKITNADRTLDALRDLFATYRRAVNLDELVAEVIRRGILRDAERGTAGWRDRARSVRAHIQRHRSKIDDRGDDNYALRP